MSDEELLKILLTTEGVVLATTPSRNRLVDLKMRIRRVVDGRFDYCVSPYFLSFSYARGNWFQRLYQTVFPKHKKHLKIHFIHPEHICTSGFGPNTVFVDNYSGFSRKMLREIDCRCTKIIELGEPS